MQIFIDKFITVVGKFGETKHVNRAFVPIGEPLKVLNEQKTSRRLILMSTGIIYQRPETYVESSPYGYNNLHKMFAFISREKKSFSVFDSAMNYELALHLTNLTKISKVTYVTEELRQNDVRKAIDNFHDIQVKLYDQFGLKNNIVEIFKNFDKFGENADNFI